MNLSARNQLKGKVIEVVKGAVMAKVKVDVGGAHLTAAVLAESVDELGIAPGVEVYAVIKATSVMLAR